jgi:hypothetical protein
MLAVVLSMMNGATNHGVKLLLFFGIIALQSGTGALSLNPVVTTTTISIYFIMRGVTGRHAMVSSFRLDERVSRFRKSGKDFTNQLQTTLPQSNPW